METSKSPVTGKKGIGNLINKLKTVLRTGSTSREIREPSQPAGAQQSPTPASERKQDTASDNVVDNPEIPTQELFAMQAPTGSQDVIEPDTVDHYDRRQVVLTTYNFDIEQPKWPAYNIPQLERVSKPIRMRVRYTCHRCNTSFGHDRECNSCRHRRCTRCDRYPPRKPRPAVPGMQATTSAQVVPAEIAPEKAEPVPADHICTCHECQTVIEVEVEECPNCHHTICDRCHKEARLQSVDAQTENRTSPAGGEERKAQPEEQKLPPDIGTTEEAQPAATR